MMKRIQNWLLSGIVCEEIRTKKWIIIVKIAL